MNNDYNHIEKIVTNLKNNHENNKSNSLYLYGKSGIGKTTTVKKILKNNNIDYLYYDINNLKDRTNFNNTFYSNTGNVNIMNCFFKQNDNKIIYVIDNIDHIQNNEKIFLGNIIKAIRPRKKTKKITDNKKNKKNKNIQNLDSLIIFIGSNNYEKKIKELIKISIFYEIKKKEDSYFKNIIDTSFKLNINKDNYQLIHNFCNNNYNKINLLKNIFNKINQLNHNYNLDYLLNQKQTNSYNENIIYCVNKLLFVPKTNKNDIYIHDNDKTIVSLLFHENIIDYLSQPNDYTFYKNFLNNICMGDYYDRICFQKQIWLINDMTYYIKIDKNYEEYNKLKSVNNFLSYIKKNNSFDNKKLLLNTCNNKESYCKIYNKYLKENNKKVELDNKKINLKTESRFTKVLTKYSTEYNNNNFIISLSRKLQVDRKNLFTIFYSNFENEDFYNRLEEYDINKLDIKRLNTIIFRE